MMIINNNEPQLPEKKSVPMMMKKKKKKPCLANPTTTKKEDDDKAHTKKEEEEDDDGDDEDDDDDDDSEEGGAEDEEEEEEDAPPAVLDVVVGPGKKKREPTAASPPPGVVAPTIIKKEEEAAVASSYYHYSSGHDASGGGHPQQAAATANNSSLVQKEEPTLISAHPLGPHSGTLRGTLPSHDIKALVSVCTQHAHHHAQQQQQPPNNNNNIIEHGADATMMRLLLDSTTDEPPSSSSNNWGSHGDDNHNHNHNNHNHNNNNNKNGAAPMGTARIKRLVMTQLTPPPAAAATTTTTTPPHGAEQPPAPSPPHHVLDTDCLLSRLPYRKMLSDMFGGSLRGNLRNLTIPYVTRAYEEAFMREPSHSSERECANGKQCECMFIDRSQPFVAVEFLLPGEQMPRTSHLCVLCCRAITQQLYYDVMFDRTEFPGTIQRFGNIHSQPGEYALDAMLIAMPSAPVHIMPLPIVSHQRNRYTVYVSGGIKRLRQSRVYFQSTPSSLADGGM